MTFCLCVGLALGDNFVALATSKRYLRLFSYSGIQRHILCLNGDICTIATKNHTLAVVYFLDGTNQLFNQFGITHNTNDIISSNQQFFSGTKYLGFTLFNVLKKETVFEGVLPLGRGTRLEWIGFTEEDSVSDSLS